MCKKRTSDSKFNLIWYNFCTFFSLLVAVMFLQGCANEDEYLHRNELVLSTYTELTEQIADRNFNGLMEYIDSDKEEVSDLSWKALAKTEPVEGELDELLERAFQVDEKGGWFAISFHELSEEQLERIRRAFQNGEIESNSVCEVFFRQGESDDAEELMTSGNVIDSEVCAKAVGGILSREQVSDELNHDLLRLAFESDESTIRRNLLYGHYRAAVNRPDPRSEIASDILNRWQEFGIGQDEFLDMTMVRIFGIKGFRLAMDQLSDRQLQDMTGLAVDLAIAVGEKVPEREDVDPIFRLLQHKNNHVVVQTLASLSQHNRLTTPFLEKIEQEVTIPTRDAEIFAVSMNLFLQNEYRVSPHRFRLDQFAENNPYLTNQFLIVYSALDTDEEYFLRLKGLIEKGGIEALHAGQMLTTFLQRPHINDQFRESVYELVEWVLNEGNRSMLDGMTEIFQNDEIVPDSAFNLLENAYRNYVDQDKPEQAQIIERVLEERFSDQFESSDLDFEDPFRLPNTDRLYEMGVRPFWELETEKGTIIVRLDPLSAPFTVSSIDSLTRAGVYDGVVFHRVVRNFVAQGGDFDRRDGFGGPDYRIPTEPSFETFERGMAGIASSGTDTEGSQFFFMHRWAPHLDGHYTNFGQITRGIDVLDKLQMGDKILKARMYPE